MTKARCCQIAALAVAITLGTPGGAIAAPTAETAAKRCGTFKHHYTYTVSRSGDTTCRFAMRIVRSFITNHSAWTKHSVDGTVAGTHYTNRRFRGWRCAEGSGGGSCYRTRDNSTYAGYQNR